MKRILPLLMLISMVGLSSCINKNLDKQLFGTWNVTKVEGTFTIAGIVLPTVSDPEPTGTVTFNRNGTGKQNYTFTANGTSYSNTDNFNWKATNTEIIIERPNDTDLVWKRIMDTDEKQVTSYTIIVDANRSWDYILTLEK